MTEKCFDKVFIVVFVIGYFYCTGNAQGGVGTSRTPINRLYFPSNPTARLIPNLQLKVFISFPQNSE